MSKRGGKATDNSVDVDRRETLVLCCSVWLLQAAGLVARLVKGTTILRNSLAEDFLSVS